MPPPPPPPPASHLQTLCPCNHYLIAWQFKKLLPSSYPRLPRPSSTRKTSEKWETTRPGALYTSATCPTTSLRRSSTTSSAILEESCGAQPACSFIAKVCQYLLARSSRKCINLLEFLPRCCFDASCSCDIPMVGGRFKGFAFVEFEDHRDAKVLLLLPPPLPPSVPALTTTPSSPGRRL